MSEPYSTDSLEILSFQLSHLTQQCKLGAIAALLFYTIKKKINENSKRIFHIIQKFHKFFQNSTKLYKILQNFTKFYKTLQNSTKLYKILQNIGKLYKIVKNFTKLYKIVENCPNL